MCSGQTVFIYFVKMLEDEFWEKDEMIEEVMDCFTVSVGGIDSK